MLTDLTLHILTTIASELSFATTFVRIHIVHFTDMKTKNEDWIVSYPDIFYTYSAALPLVATAFLEYGKLSENYAQGLDVLSHICWDKFPEKPVFFCHFLPKCESSFRVGWRFASFSSLLAKRCHFPPPPHPLPFQLSHNIMNLMMGEIRFSITPQ